MNWIKRAAFIAVLSIPAFAQFSGGGGGGNTNIVTPEKYGAFGNGGVFFDGAMTGSTAVVGTAFNNNSATASAPSVTTLVANDMVLNVWAANATWLTPPATGNVRVNLTESAGKYGLQMNDQAIAVAGSVPASTGTLSATNRWLGTTIALAPAGTITFINASTAQQASGANLVLNVPTSTANADTMIACVAWFASTNTLTSPGNWFPLTSVITGSSDKLQCYYRYANSEPASYTWTESGASNGMAGFIATYRNASMVDGTGTLTSSTAAFTSASVGNPICLSYSATAEYCGFITQYNSATSVLTTVPATSNISSEQFAYGTDDTAAFTAMKAANPNGANIILGCKAYILMGSFSFAINVPWTITGCGAGVPWTGNGKINSNVLPQMNNGTRLMWLTQSLTAPAITVAGTSNNTAITAAVSFSGFAMLGGNSNGTRDGGGGSVAVDGLDVINWQSFLGTNLYVFNFSGNGIYVDGNATGGVRNFLEAINLVGPYVSYNNLSGILVGGNNSVSDVETVRIDSGIIEGNGGPAVSVNAPHLQGFTFTNNTVQWNNVNATGLEMAGSGVIEGGCNISGNYFEFDSNLSSQSQGIFNTGAAPQAATYVPCNPSASLNHYLSGSYTPISFNGSGAAAIPACSATQNHISACVTDAAACTNGTTYAAAGGAVVCRVQCVSGTGWVETGTALDCR